MAWLKIYQILVMRPHIVILAQKLMKEINANVIDYFHYISKLIKDKNIEGITNLTPSYNKLIISFRLK